MKEEKIIKQLKRDFKITRENIREYNRKLDEAEEWEIADHEYDVKLLKALRIVLHYYGVTIKE